MYAAPDDYDFYYPYCRRVDGNGFGFYHVDDEGQIHGDKDDKGNIQPYDENWVIIYLSPTEMKMEKHPIKK